MFVFAVEHPVLAALVVLFAGWFARFLHQGYTVRQILHNQVSEVIDATFLCSNTNSITAWTTALMALGSSEDDGRHGER